VSSTDWSLNNDPNPYAPDSRLSEPSGPLGVRLLDVFGSDSPFLPRVLELFWDLFPKYRRYLEYIRACALRHTPDHPNAVGHVWAVYDPNYVDTDTNNELNSELDSELDSESTRGLDYPALNNLNNLEDHDAKLHKIARGIIGFQIFNYVAPQRGGGGFGLGAFRGLLEGYQHGGVGAWLLREALEQLTLDAQDRGDLPPVGHVVEVEPLANPEKREIFAQKTGSILLEGEYLEPPMLRGVSYARAEDLLGVVPKLMQLVFYTQHPREPLSRKETCTLLEGIYLDYYLLERKDNLFLHACESVFQEESLELLATSPITIATVSLSRNST
jgi:hypothetical protein